MTIAGTAAFKAAASAIGDSNSPPAAGVTVTVSGTALSAVTNAAGYFQLNGVPSGTVKLRFVQSGLDASTDVSGVGSQQLVTIEVQLSGSSAVIVTDVRSDAKLSLCHRSADVGYHMITIDPNAEAAHRAHGDAKVGERVPGTTAQTFDENCQAVGPAIALEKSTNGDDADSAPGPSIVVGQPVTWTYVVKNTGTIALTSVSVVDDMGVSISCPAANLAAGQSMTCSGSGVATLGQYRNVGTASASSTMGSVTASDPSHYLGVAPDEQSGPKVDICHRTGNGSYHLISIAESAEPAHRAHGDGRIGESVPNSPGKVFAAGCSVR